MRSAGILLPVFSLPSKYGIGTFGKKAYEFVDFLHLGRQSYWQILPLVPTSFGDSPYQSVSAFAGNPYFIDPEILLEKGYVREEDLSLLSDGGAYIDYGALYRERYPFLRRAYEGFRRSPPADFAAYCEREGEWLTPYALFMVLKETLPGQTFRDWDGDTLHRRNFDALCARYAEQMDFWRFLQYEFEAEWLALKAYANARGIRIIGDLPIYVSSDSADVWAHPEQFLLDGDLRSTKVAGVPPDAFSAEGQLWGNPLYDWAYMKEDGYRWWKSRLARSARLYDRIRIDHFVGFSNYYAIPADASDALGGEILPGPGAPFFASVRQAIGRVDIIAEDLGMLQEGVPELLATTGFPGMKVIQFSFFGEDNPHALARHTRNCVVYTGTHDNQTLAGFWRGLSVEVRRSLSRRFPQGYPHIIDRVIAYAMSSVADTVIIPMQDYMRLGDEARINTPAVLSSRNWAWRLPADYSRASVGRRILTLTCDFSRAR